MLYQFLKFKTKDLDKIKVMDKASIIVNKNDLAQSARIAMEASIDVCLAVAVALVAVA